MRTTSELPQQAVKLDKGSKAFHQPMFAEIGLPVAHAIPCYESVPL